ESGNRPISSRPVAWTGRPRRSASQNSSIRGDRLRIAMAASDGWDSSAGSPPSGTDIFGRIVCQPDRIRAVRIHHVDLMAVAAVGAVAVARKGDLRAVGRPLRVPIIARADLYLIRAVRI